MKDKLTKTLPILIAIGFTAIYLNSFIEWIINGWLNYYVRCADFWQYLYEAKKYTLPNVFLKDIIEVWKEPWVFLISSIFNRITWIDSGIALIVVAYIAHVITLLGIFIGIKRYTGSTATWILTLTLASTLYLTNTTLAFLTIRQNLSNSFLLLMLITPLLGINNFRKAIIGGIFMGGCILWHRIGLMFSIIWLSVYYFILIIKKEGKHFKHFLSIGWLGILLTIPYIALQLWDIIYTLEWYTSRIGLIKIDNSAVVEVWDTKLDGWSFFSLSNTINWLPIGHYTKYVSYIIIISISNLKNIKKLLNRKTGLILTTFICVTIYIATKLIFWVRILATFEILLITVLWLTNQSKLKKIAIFFLFWCILIWISSLAPRSIVNPRILPKKNDPWIDFLEKKIVKKNSYLVGPYCVADLAEQLWLEWSNSISYSPIWKHKERELSWEINYYTAIDITTALMASIPYKPYVHNILRGKNLYFVFGPWTSNSELWQLRNKTHPYYDSPYLELIYGDYSNNYEWSPRWVVVRFIFKIKNEYITYFEDINYLNKNLKWIK